jgi:hypothetical protein
MLAAWPTSSPSAKSLRFASTTSLTLNFSGFSFASANRASISASGSPTFGMLVEMLVERVFPVSGVVKTVFHETKKMRDFFCFSPRTKGSKAGLRGKF